jgi:hypothetical protein
MTIWLVRIVTVVWAGFWLWFGLASAVVESLSWQSTVLYAVRPGLIFAGIALFAWMWPRPGGVVLVVAAFVLAAWYGIYYGEKPTSLKLFVLSTIALPPLAAGLVLLWPSDAGSAPHHHPVS